jgi:hypothetical protein
VFHRASADTLVAHPFEVDLMRRMVPVGAWARLPVAYWDDNEVAREMLPHIDPVAANWIAFNGVAGLLPP